MAQVENKQVSKVMNRLRAQLFNMVEQMGFDETQSNAFKQTIKDITSDAWNGVGDIIENFEDKKE